MPVGIDQGNPLSGRIERRPGQLPERIQVIELATARKGFPDTFS